MSLWESKVKTVLQSAELLLTSGAEMYRVEETAQRIGRAVGFSQVEIFVIPTGIFVTLVTAEGTVFTRVRRIRGFDNNLERIARINRLSRELEQGRSYEEVSSDLCAIEVEQVKASWSFPFFAGLGSGAFAIVFGGGLFEALFATGIGLVVLLFLYLCQHFPAPRFVTSALGASLAAILGLFGQALFSLNGDLVILGGVMVLVPGVTMTTAVRDMLSGELLSGVSRGVDAIIIAVAVAVGVGVVLSIGGGV